MMSRIVHPQGLMSVSAQTSSRNKANLEPELREVCQQIVKPCRGEAHAAVGGTVVHP
jgi:hypothetical protein